MTVQRRTSAYVSRRSGIVLLLALVVFFVAVLQAGVLRDLLRSESTLRVILPETGLSGLAEGAAVEVLGTRAGTVRKLVLSTETSFHAEVGIDETLRPFIRSDSQVFIRKQFGIAGAAYLEISRGHGAPLDWDYAVLTATEEVAPTASVGELIADVRLKVLPVVDELRQTLRVANALVGNLANPDGTAQKALANASILTARIVEGEGNLGRLLSDDKLTTELEGAITELRTTMQSASAIFANLHLTTSEVAEMAANFSSQSRKLPAVIDNTNATLVSLNKVMAEVSRSLPEVTELMRNSAEASAALPTLLAQTQQTLATMERLLGQLQGSWLLGGGGEGGPPPVDRLSPVEARP